LISKGTGEITANVNGKDVFNASSNFGFKNRIINSDMRIDQRNAGASVTPAISGVYLVDRWFYNTGTASKFTAQQNAGSVTPPTGFTNYLGLTSSSAYTPASSDYFQLLQRIEGYNIADLGWGTSSASSVTLSFWVRSSLTGQFGGAIRNSPNYTYTYPFSFTINSANTWQYVTITVVGANASQGVWNTSNSAGIEIVFNLGSGSSFLSTAGTWQSGSFFGVTGDTKVVGTNGATFYITGVQLEKGSTATSFDYRPYGTELALCQRYYYSSDKEQLYTALGTGWEQSSTAATAYCSVPVPMRVAATAVTYNNLQLNDSGGANPTVSSLVISTIECSRILMNLQLVITGGGAGRVAALRGANSTAAYLAFSAEL
jgi:hypothetical protein